MPPQQAHQVTGQELEREQAHQTTGRRWGVLHLTEAEARCELGACRLEYRKSIPFLVLTLVMLTRLTEVVTLSNENVVQNFSESSDRADASVL